MPWTPIKEPPSLTLATLTSRPVYSSSGLVVAMAADRLRHLNLLMYILKPTRPPVLLAQLDHNGVVLHSSLLLAVLHLRLLELAITGLADSPTSTHHHNHPIRMRTEESRSGDLPRLPSASPVLNRTSRCGKEDIMNPEVLLLVHLAEGLLQHLAPISMDNPLRLRRKAQLRLNDELPILTGEAHLRHPGLSQTVLMEPTRLPMVLLPSDPKPTALEVRLDLMIIECRPQSRLTLSTRRLPVTPLIILRVLLRQVLLRMALRHLLAPALMRLHSALMTVHPLLGQNGCASGKKSRLPRSRLMRKTALVWMI